VKLLNVVPGLGLIVVAGLLLTIGPLRSRDVSLIHAPDRQTGTFFEQNLGQERGDVSFIAHSPQYDLALGRSQIVFSSKRVRGDKENVSLSWPSLGRDLDIRGETRLPTVVNYYVGPDPQNWHSAIPTFARVAYHNLFAGIDLPFLREGWKCGI
jgi:hypothetical protein